VTPSDAHVEVICGVMSAFGLPTVATLWRISGRLARSDERLREVTEDLATHVADDKAVRDELIATMREDRAATNERLTWIERARTH
jgi:acyl transferase domain-containing protein